MPSENKQLLSSQYLYQIQTRTEKEIQLTDKLARALTELNLKRISQRKSIDHNDKLNKNNSPYFFIGISGIPPFDNQYQNLELPGEMINISLTGLKGKYSEQQYVQIFKRGGFTQQAYKIRQNIIRQSEKGKKIVIIYHSFGSFSFMKYLHIFKEDHKVSGIIDIGGASIRFYPLLGGFIQHTSQATHQFLLQNAQQIYQAHLHDPQRKKAGFIPFQNKYQTIIHVRLGSDPIFKNTFELMRNMPKVLKLFLYGRKDRIFPQNLINQKVIYYSYINKLNKDYQQKLKSSYSKYYGFSCNNIQQRFIFNIQGGQHSLHMQNKYNQQVKTAVYQYLEVLKQVL